MENLFPQAPSSPSVEKPGLRLEEGTGGIEGSVCEVAEGNLRHLDLSETRLKAKGLLRCRERQVVRQRAWVPKELIF